MFEKRTWIALAAVTLVGAGAAYQLTRQDPYVKAAGQPSTAGVPALRAAELDQLEIVEGQKPPIVLEKQGGTWRLAKPVADRADARAVEALLASLEKLAFRDVVAETTASYATLEVADADVIKLVPKKAGAALTTLLVGKKDFVRVGTNARVWRVSEALRPMLGRGAEAWRARDILRFERDAVTSVSWTGPTGTVTAQRAAKGEAWRLTQGENLVGGALDASVPKNLVSALSHLDAGDFADGATVDTAGLASPRARLVVEAAGTRHELLVGRLDGGSAFVQGGDGKRIWKVLKAVAEQLVVEPVQWRDKALTKLDVADVTSVELKTEKSRLVFERTAKSDWQPSAATPLPDLDPGRVEQLVKHLSSVQATAIDTTTDLKKAGLAAPAQTLVVTLKDKTKVTLTIGAKVDSGYYAKVSTRPELFRLGEFVARRLLKTPPDFDKNVQTMDPEALQGFTGNF